jgi:hypothetical protein
MNVMSQESWLEFLDKYVDSGKPSRIRLFQNDHEPDPTDMAGDYVQATFSGYPGYTELTWGDAFLNASDQGQVNAAQVLWEHSGGATGNTIYGVYVTDDDDILQYAERFAAPISMTTSADSLEYQARLTLINQ